MIQITNQHRLVSPSKILVLLSLIGFFACDEENKPLKDTLQTEFSAPEVSDIGLYMASIEGNVTFEGEELQNRGFGVVWSTTPQPEPVDSIQSSWQDRSVSSITRSPFPIFEIARKLELNTTYYTRTYFVYEDLSLDYGPEVSFTTLAGDAWHAHQNEYPGASRQFLSGFLIGNELYAGIGFRDGAVEAITEWWSYDLSEEQWQEKESIPEQVGLHSRGFSIEDKGYMLSASENENPASFWEYDASNNRWTKKADFPSASRNYPLAIALEGKGYISGGLFFASNEMWEFDPSDASNGVDEHGNPMGTWAQKSAKGGGSIDRPTSFVIGDQIYMYNAYVSVMPNSERIERAEFWSYSPIDDVWVRKADYPGEVDTQDAFAKVGFSIGDLGYLGSGENAELWSYDPTLDGWIEKVSPAPGGADINFSTDDRGYFLAVGGGIIEYLP